MDYTSLTHNRRHCVQSNTHSRRCITEQSISLSILNLAIRGKWGVSFKPRSP